MRRISVNGSLYAAPFESLFRPLTEDEWECLGGSVAAHGVLDAVHVYTSDLHGRAIIDGINRAEIAERIGRDVPTKDYGRISDTDAEELASTLNADRRHLTIKELTEYAARRRERVAWLRSRGASLRQIARREGVSLGQVQRDISTVSGDTPEKALARCRMAVDRAIKAAALLAGGDHAARLLALAATHGVPLRRDGGACVWPALVGVRAALADLAAQTACGATV